MRKNKRKILYLPVIAMLVFSTACGRGQSGDIVTGRYYNPNSAGTKETVQSKAEEAEGGAEVVLTDKKDELGTDVFLIISNNMQTETLILKQIASGKQYMYNYSLITRFLDKYGTRTTVSDFASGRCMTVAQKDIQGRLLEAQLSDAVWEYPDVTRYTVDEERGIFEIADMKYAFDEGLFVNSDGEYVELSELSDMDTLRLVGFGKKLLSVSVTTGHGALQLSNTELFEGSFIQIGDKIFSEITKDMLLDIPEGTYTVTVANNGYGGSTDVTIERNETTKLDLDTLKGEGPKFGNILFAVNVAGAIVQIDGQTVDYSQPIPLQYGVHALTVIADSYDTYSKQLFVNSKEATVIIGLDESSAAVASSNTSSSEAASSEVASSEGSLAGSLAGSKTGTGAAGSLAGSLAGSKTGYGNNTGSSSALTSGVNADQIDQSVVDAALAAALGNDSSLSNLYSGAASSDYISTLTELLKIITDNGD